MSKIMKKMLSVGTACALLVCMAIPTAFAETVTSTATVDFGSKDTVDGGVRILYAFPLNGRVEGTGNPRGSLTGEIWTKGNVFSHKRAHATIGDNQTVGNLSWENKDKESGSFWARCYSSEGNRGGQCTVSQNQ